MRALKPLGVRRSGPPWWPTGRVPTARPTRCRQAAYLRRGQRARSRHAHLLCLPHHLDIVEGQVASVRRRTVEGNLGEPGMPPQVVVDRPSRRRVDRRTSGDEQDRMPVKSKDQRVPLVQEVAVSTGESIRRDLIGCHARRPDEGRDLQRVIGQWGNQCGRRLRLSWHRGAEEVS